MVSSCQAWAYHTSPRAKHVDPRRKKLGFSRLEPPTWWIEKVPKFCIPSNLIIKLCCKTKTTASWNGTEIVRKLEVCWLSFSTLTIYLIQSSTDQACIRHRGAGTDRDCPGASRKDHDWSLVVNISTWVKMRQRLRSGLQLVSCTSWGDLWSRSQCDNKQELETATKAGCKFQTTSFESPLLP